jgi:hypothetical protein
VTFTSPSELAIFKTIAFNHVLKIVVLIFIITFGMDFHAVYFAFLLGITVCQV